MTKRWIIVLAVTGALAALISAGAVLAQEGGAKDSPNRQNLASRVATILGLEESVVKDAFGQAHRDMRNERFQNRLDLLVAKGRLTQEHADELRNWRESRPDFPADAFWGSGKGHKGHIIQGRRMFERHGFAPWGGRFGRYHKIPGALPPISGGSSS